MSEQSEGSEAFVKLCMEVSSYATVLTSKMQGEGNDTANALLHSLSLFLAVNGTPDEVEKQARAFADALPDLARRYAEAMKGLPDA